MSKKVTPTDPSSSEFNDEATSSEDQQRSSTKRRSKKNSIKSYVTDVISKRDSDDGQPTDLTQTRIKIDSTGDTLRNYDNVSAFRQYPSNAEGATRTGAQRQLGQESSSDEEARRDTATEQVNRLFCL
jgi:hypothetical protein